MSMPPYMHFYLSHIPIAQDAQEEQETRVGMQTSVSVSSVWSAAGRLEMLSAHGKFACLFLQAVFELLPAGELQL